MNQTIHTRVILDYDGTLTCEEQQAQLLKVRSLERLAGQYLGVSPAETEKMCPSPSVLSNYLRGLSSARVACVRALV